MAPTDDVDVAAEVSEFTSLLRARLAGVVDEDNPAGHSPGEDLWNSVHGTATMQASTLQELADRFGHILFVKRNIACVVAAMLAVDLAKHTGRSAIDIIDEVERDLIDGQSS